MSSCLSFNAVCNPLVFAMVKSPSSMVSCFVPISVIIFTSFTNKSPVISTFPVIEPPVSSNLLSNAVCNPDVFAMVKSPSLIVGCLFPNSVMMLVVPTTKTPVISTFPLIEPPVSSNLLSNAVCNPDVFAMVKSLSCISSCFVPISDKRLVVPTKNEVL